MESQVRSLMNSDWSQLAPQGAGPAPPGSPTRSYGVLRESLQETQRRCESLNHDMVRQAEANEELMQTLGTVKDANKRLLEQIRTQTDEITRLTQQRVLDEERMDVVSKRHRQSYEELERETQQHI